MKNILGYWKYRGQEIIDGEIFCWPILKPIFLTTNMAIKQTKKNSGSNLSKDISLLIYIVLYLTILVIYTIAETTEPASKI